MASIIGIESLLTSLALLVALTYPQLGSRWFATAERTLGALGRRRRTSIQHLVQNVQVCWSGLDSVFTRLPLIRWLAWNVVIWGQKKLT